MKKKTNIKAQGTLEGLPKCEVSRERIGDLIYQVLSGKLSAVYNEIIAEIELVDNEGNYITNRS